jgi:DNA helicase II / ATP-dependent DNA helicase PcrA
MKPKLLQSSPEIVIQKIKKIHSDDPDQIEAILSTDRVINIQAPAGCGKTKTLVSKLAYLIITNRIESPKKILCLTFSVNAAYKIRKDVAENLPEILSINPISPLNITNRVVTTNYHGICRRILKYYGYLIHPSLAKIELMKGLDDHDAKELFQMDIGLNYDDSQLLASYNHAIKEIDVDFLKNNSGQYLRIVNEHLLSNQFIPFNAILLLTLDLFNKKPQILQFYNHYFPIIIVDEFQDTNILSWTLLKKLIKDETMVTLMGDPLQRIYGFIGAIPDLLEKAKTDYNGTEIILSKNYRYKDNEILLQLDKNIRENAKNPRNPKIEKIVRVNLLNTYNQENEALEILGLVKEIIKNDNCGKIAILTKQRGNNINKIFEVFSNNSQPYFYALYSDEDAEYIDFHRKCLTEFLEFINKQNSRLNKNQIQLFVNKISSFYKQNITDVN